MWMWYVAKFAFHVILLLCTVMPFLIFLSTLLHIGFNFVSSKSDPISFNKILSGGFWIRFSCESETVKFLFTWFYGIGRKNSYCAKYSMIIVGKGEKF